MVFDMSIEGHLCVNLVCQSWQSFGSTVQTHCYTPTQLLVYGRVGWYISTLLLVSSVSSLFVSSENVLFVFISQKLRFLFHVF